MAHHVYILFSPSLKRYYIGNTDLSPVERMEEHNSKRNENAFTSKGIPWGMYLFFGCESRLQARRIETHIKKMKSKEYIENLKKYPEMTKKLLEKYSSF